jgi:hypothetical protein
MPDYPQMPPEQQYQPAAPPPPPPPKAGVGKYIALAGVGCLLLLGIIGAIVFLVFRLTAGPVDVVNKHLKALADGKIGEAYAMCSREFQKATSLEDYRNFVERYSILKNASKFSSNDRKIENGVANLNGKIEGKDDSSVPALFKLVKEGGSWKILYVNITAGPDATEPRRMTETPGVQQPEAQQQKTPEVDPGTQESNESTNQPATESSGYRIAEVKLDKQSSGNIITVKIEFKVFGFANDKSSGSARIHLIEDLETVDPQGAVVPDLTRKAIKELAESGSFEEYTVANFTNTLTIPTSYPTGKYTAKITVNDRIAEKTAETAVQFDIP